MISPLVHPTAPDWRWCRVPSLFLSLCHTLSLSLFLGPGWWEHFFGAKWTALLVLHLRVRLEYCRFTQCVGRCVPFCRCNLKVGEVFPGPIHFLFKTWRIIFDISAYSECVEMDISVLRMPRPTFYWVCIHEDMSTILNIRLCDFAGDPPSHPRPENKSEQEFRRPLQKLRLVFHNFTTALAAWIAPVSWPLKCDMRNKNRTQVSDRMQTGTSSTSMHTQNDTNCLQSLQTSNYIDYDCTVRSTYMTVETRTLVSF